MLPSLAIMKFTPYIYCVLHVHVYFCWGEGPDMNMTMAHQVLCILPVRAMNIKGTTQIGLVLRYGSQVCNRAVRRQWRKS